MDPTSLREMVAHNSQTKTALAETLRVLSKQGYLEIGATKRELREASEHHAKQDTPYGRVVQRIELNVPGLKYLDFINPFAFLYYLTMISAAFAALMHDCCRDATRPLRLVIYMDEMNPGNPFRPEKSRTLQCVYWAFVDWPAHVLSRTFSWIVFCTIRSNIVAKIEGGMSFMCRLILRTFFPKTGHSMDRGIMLNHKSDTYVMTARFAGFLCDLKGHKENLEWKGTGGNVCCITCANCDKRLVGDHAGNVVGIDCGDSSRFVHRSNMDVYNTVDELVGLHHAATTKTAREALETAYGFNVCPQGILVDHEMRDVFKPVDHTLRDWQHVLVGDGVANSILGETLNALKGFGYPMDTVRNFMLECTLPSKYGKACANWLKDSRLKLHTLTSFAGIILTLVPILFLYMQSFCGDDARVSDHFRLVKLLHIVCGILGTGTDVPMKHIDLLEGLFKQLHELYVELYTKCKPKIHHMHHIVDAMRWLGKCLSCFVTERKHRTVKDIALHIFRNMEHTVIVDIVNAHCEQILTGRDLFLEMFLVEPREVKLQPEFLTSRKAVLHFGSARTDDVVFFTDMTCATIVAFFIISDTYFVEVAPLPKVSDDDATLRRRTNDDSYFKECRFLVDSCIWHSTETAGIIKVCVPPILLV